MRNQESLHAGNGLDESWRKFCGTVRKCLALYLPLLAADGDTAALAGASAYLRTRSNWTFNVMPDLARFARARGSVTMGRLVKSLLWEFKGQGSVSSAVCWLGLANRLM